MGMKITYKLSFKWNYWT